MMLTLLHRQELEDREREINALTRGWMIDPVEVRCERVLASGAYGEVGRLQRKLFALEDAVNLKCFLDVGLACKLG